MELSLRLLVQPPVTADAGPDDGALAGVHLQVSRHALHDKLHTLDDVVELVGVTLEVRQAAGVRELPPITRAHHAIWGERSEVSEEFVGDIGRSEVNGGDIWRSEVNVGDIWKSEVNVGDIWRSEVNVGDVSRLEVDGGDVCRSEVNERFMRDIGMLEVNEGFVD